MGVLEGPIHLPLRRSPRLVRLVALAHAAALAWIALAFPPSAPRTLLLAAIVVDAVLALHRLTRQRGDDVVALLLDADDRWRLTLRDGRTVAARLHRAPLISGALTALTLRLVDGGVRHLVLCCDAVPAAAYRRLRVRLRWPRRDTAPVRQPR